MDHGSEWRKNSLGRSRSCTERIEKNLFFLYDKKWINPQFWALRFSIRVRMPTHACGGVFVASIMKEGFDIEPHALGAHIRICAKTPQNVFLHALKGVASYLCPDVLLAAKKGEHAFESLRVDAVDINSLLISFLSEILAKTEMSGVIFTHAEFHQFGDNFLEGEIAGVSVDQMERSVKAVSYDGVDIKKDQKKNLYECSVILEV